SAQRKSLAAHPSIGTALGLRVPAAGTALRGDAHRRGSLRLLLYATRAGGHGRPADRRSPFGPGRVAVRLLRGARTALGGCPVSCAKSLPGRRRNHGQEGGSLAP